ncbi:MAG: DUF3783 domain-containing protein [Lachnoclostridium edouardi]|uniref:DUF3783 domain-containing protein n=1 Tax=Lachnoclostridium edouardi TaxID=1926283 RepID=UPI0026DCBCD7|nr:DUF3783 domain-containing protein [Lachnoclostridium edouardi]MDO4277875.1 DUF3783 domain-containing protein [Lachnoclostridium edouardi]
MKTMRETVLYYTPEVTERTARLKGIFVRLGIRIKNITPEQTEEKVGYLFGLPGFLPKAAGSEKLLKIEDEMLVMKGFTSRRIDELLLAVRKAGLSRIDLKAVVTDSNAGWTFYQLYEEIKEERRQILEKAEKSKDLEEEEKK